MKILIDIGHPAHVHYFRNFIKIMEKNGHKFLIIAKNRSIVPYLLKYYNIPFILRKNYPKNIFGKFFQIIFTDLFVIKEVKKFKADLLLGFSGTHVSHAGVILNIPSIIFDDTDNANLAHASYKNFASSILTPTCFKKKFGKKQIYFNSFMELCYLHPKYYKPDSSILNLIGIKKDEKYVIIRFVSWNSNHDLGHKGISQKNKLKIVKEFSKYARVFISSEKNLPKELKKYEIKFPPEKIHDALAYSNLLFGESATMASECACLGVPSIYHDSIGRGYTEEEEKKYGLVFNFSETNKDQDLSIKKGIDILNDKNSTKNYKKKRNKILDDKIDVTAFMIWFVENYPKSKKLMNENPNYQLKFKEMSKSVKKRLYF
jgi:predicted glycosyltransferase